MAPPTGPLNLDVEAISGICGSISIACWVVVFSPQIIENFRRGSADGLSLQFIIVWLAGDVFNILGAVLQGVLPTMIILAVYYTIADIVLLGQCFYYRGFTWRDEVVPPPTPKRTPKKIAAASSDRAGTSSTAPAAATERTALLANNDDDDNNNNDITGKNYATSEEHHARRHPSSHHERRGSNWSALSPAVPFVPEMGHHDQHHHQHHQHHNSSTAAVASAPEVSAPAATPKASSPSSSPSATSARLQAAAFNIVAMLMVCAAGVAGWYLSSGRSRHKTPDNNNDDSTTPPTMPDDLVLDVWGQIFGYFCAALYLGSRLPQLLLNWRRQSTDGVSMLFFLFACLGNLTYVLSIFAYDGCQGMAGVDGCTPAMARHRYGRYLLVNLSWLAGSLGTLLLDMGIFVQFFLYRVADGDEEDFYDEYDDDEHTQVAGGDGDDDESDEEGHTNRWDQRPILQRNLSTRD